VTGTATLSGGTKLYNFSITGSLPTATSAGGMSVTITGDGFSYSLPSPHGTRVKPSP